MQLCHVLHPNAVCIDSISETKTAVLLKVSDLVSQNYAYLDSQELFAAYWKRESLGSTAIGKGITIPHVATTAITKAQACVIRLLNPVDFGAADKQPVDLVVGLLVPQNQTDSHLTMLAAIAKQFGVPAFREACRRSATSEALYNLLIKEELYEELLV